MNEETTWHHLSPQWRAWVTENMLLGADPDLIRAQLVQRGVPDAAAKDYLSTLQDMPEFQGARSATRRTRQFETILRLPKVLAAQSETLRVSRIPELDGPAFYAEYYSQNRPVVIPDFASNWPALERWTPTYFKESFGQVEVRVTSDRERDPHYDMRHEEHTETVTMTDYVDRVLASDSSNDLYMVANNRNLETPALAPLMDEVEFDPDYLDGERWRGSAALWLGPTGTITPLHHDTCNIMFIQIYGRKRVHLFAPYETALLQDAHAMYAGVDPEALPRNFPAEPYVVDLGPGDAIFLPIGWWHHVRALDVSISLAVTNFHRPNRFGWYVPGAVE